MGYERYPRNSRLNEYYGGRRDRDDDSPRDYGSGRDYSYSSARDYAAAGELGGPYGGGGFGYENRDYGRDRYGPSDAGRDTYGNRAYGADRDYRGSYWSDGQRSGDFRSDAGRNDVGRSSYGRQPQGYDYQDRGFLNRAGDEVRSWFGDEEAERRREADARYDLRNDRQRDNQYGSWRNEQIRNLDRDYDEYRRENQTRFDSEFGSWRTERQGQRDSLSRVSEHQEVVGSDGEHIGTVDKVRGDRIILTKNDSDSGGHHHSIPSRWIQSVDDKITIRKTAEEAKAHWRDEERGALFGDNRDQDQGQGAHILNRSFSGTY